jgi:hypothetical protein
MLAKIGTRGGTTQSWFSVDSEAEFNKVSKTMPDEWEYHNRNIDYTLNAQGYRTKEWADINWSESVVMIGCSNAFGLGIRQEETASSILEQELKIPFINLGVVGSSNHLMFYNSMRLIEHRIKPKNVILMFSDSSRYTHFNQQDDYIVALGHWSANSKEYSNYYYEYSNHNNCHVHGTMMAVGTEALWKSVGVQTIAYSAYPNSLKDRFKVLPPRIDRAREINHPGVLTNKIWADVIKNDLQNLKRA